MKHEDTVENGSKRLDFQLSSVHFTGLHSWTSGKSVRGTFCTQKCKVTWPPIGFTWNTRRAHTVNPRAVSTGGTALRKYGPVFHPPLSPPPPRPHSTSFFLSLSLPYFAKASNTAARIASINDKWSRVTVCLCLCEVLTNVPSFPSPRA